MFQWGVILLAALAVLLLVTGLGALILPDSYEGQTLFHFDAQHAARTLDVFGGALVGLGCAVAWTAGILWQRRMYAP
jgi:hypothetical protein